MTPIVRMLCRRSASLTRITRRSRAVAIAIFWKFSACASARDLKIVASLETPSTISATSWPNARTSDSLATPVSSSTSCSTAAAMDFASMRMDARMSATAKGWVT